MLNSMIVDPDLCIKPEGSIKYSFLIDVLPLVARKIYIHRHAYEEVRYPESAVDQLNELIRRGNVTVVDETMLDSNSRKIYSTAFAGLARAMMNPQKPNANKGEVCSLAWAKVKGIPVFATDERFLQPIVDAVLNIGIDDIRCIRIVDLVDMARNGEIMLSRKQAKILWVIAGKDKGIFDRKIWPLVLE